MAKWLRMFGFRVYRQGSLDTTIPHNFIEILKLLKPKRVIPVHTTNPGYMLRLFEKIRNV